MPMVPASAK